MSADVQLKSSSRAIHGGVYILTLELWTPLQHFRGQNSLKTVVRLNFHLETAEKSSVYGTTR